MELYFFKQYNYDVALQINCYLFHVYDLSVCLTVCVSLSVLFVCMSARAISPISSLFLALCHSLEAQGPTAAAQFQQLGLLG